MAFDLLPEKHSHFESYKVDAITILLVFIIPLCMLLIKYAIEMQQQASLQERIQIYQEELRSMSVIHAADDSVQRAGASLQATAALWKLMGSAVNESVCVSEMHRYKNKVTISGKSQSIQNVKALADNMTNAHLFKSMTLARMTETRKQSMLEFSLHADEQDH